MSEYDKPPKIKSRLIGAPKIRQLYWCDFPLDAQLPEFWKRRPVIIVSYRNTLHGAVTVIPCSSMQQESNPWAVKLSTTVDEGQSWAVCDKITSVAVSRLSMQKSGIKRLPIEEFDILVKILLKWLPSPS